MKAKLEEKTKEIGFRDFFSKEKNDCRFLFLQTYPLLVRLVPASWAFATARAKKGRRALFQRRREKEKKEFLYFFFFFFFSLSLFFFSFFSRESLLSSSKSERK